MGFLKEKYTKEYFLGYDENGNKLNYGALGGKEFLEGGEIFIDLKKSLSLIKDFENKNVLEIGFGRGETIKYMHERGIKSYYGIDFSQAACDLAQENIVSKLSGNDNIKIFCDDALGHLKTNFDELKAMDFDIIIMLDSIEHIPMQEMHEIFSIINKMTKFGTLFLAQTPFYKLDEDYCKQGKYIKPSASDITEETKGMHCNKFTKKRFLKEFKQAGFICLESNHLFVKVDDFAKSFWKSQILRYFF